EEETKRNTRKGVFKSCDEFGKRSTFIRSWKLSNKQFVDHEEQLIKKEQPAE
ncbi:hypothetical protein ACJMK2_019441, partial [Sinanodonta woodiana]